MEESLLYSGILDVPKMCLSLNRHCSAVRANKSVNSELFNILDVNLHYETFYKNGVKNLPSYELLKCRNQRG